MPSAELDLEAEQADRNVWVLPCAVEEYVETSGVTLCGTVLRARLVIDRVSQFQKGLSPQSQTQNH